MKTKRKNRKVTNSTISPLGKVLLEAQGKRNMKQTEMAELLGMSQPWYNQVVHGAKRVTDYETLLKIANVTRVNIKAVAQLAGQEIIGAAHG